MKSTYIAVKIVALCAAAGLSAGCKPADRAEEDFISRTMGVEISGEGSAPVHDIRTMTELALKIVQEGPADTNEAGLTTGQIVEQQTGALEGSVMFPRWTARRVGANDYEVRYTYTHIDNRYTMEKKGFSWVVNVAQKTAGPRRILRQEDFSDDQSGPRNACDWEPMMFRESDDNEKNSPE